MKEPKIGQLIHLILKGHPDRTFKARVLEFTEDHYFINIPRPVDEEGQEKPGSGQVYLIEYKSTDGSLCNFESKADEVRLGQGTFWKLIRPSADEITREQRREFVRVQADLPVRIEVTANNGPSSYFDTYMKDISGGGMAVLVSVKARIQVGATIKTKFSLPNSGFPVDASCFVVRIGETNDQGYHVLSLKFVQLKESVRQRIIQYTFWRQRMLV